MKKIIAVFVFIFINNNFSFAENETYFSLTLRNGTRTHGILRISRLATSFTREFKKYKIKITPFWENFCGKLEYSKDEGVRSGPFLEKYSRHELGMELGTELLNWLYVGENFYYLCEKPGPDGAEMETRIIFKRELKHINPHPILYFFEEYRYNIRRGKATDNEIGIGVLIPAGQYSLNFNWRHVDLIHALDKDFLEAGVRINF
ncbi:MAG: hypothetical protein ABH952_02635 [Candidatus Omnitrophota bacterium]